MIIFTAQEWFHTGYFSIVAAVGRLQWCVHCALLVYIVPRVGPGQVSKWVNVCVFVPE